MDESSYYNITQQDLASFRQQVLEGRCSIASEHANNREVRLLRSRREQAYHCQPGAEVASRLQAEFAARLARICVEYQQATVDSPEDIREVLRLQEEVQRRERRLLVGECAALLDLHDWSWDEESRVAARRTIEEEIGRLDQGAAKPTGGSPG